MFYVLPNVGLLLVVADFKYIYMFKKNKGNNRKQFMALWDKILQILHFNSEKGNGQMTEPGSLTSCAHKCNDVQTKVVQA